jgi:hypothetical protein
MIMNEWQPIETAPRDGTHVLGYEDGEMTVIHWSDHPPTSSYKGGYWNNIYCNDGEWWPTHWMPLPPPPTTESM